MLILPSISTMSRVYVILSIQTLIKLIFLKKPGCYFYNVVFSVQQELFYQRKSLAVVVLEGDEVLVK